MNLCFSSVTSPSLDDTITSRSDFYKTYTVEVAGKTMAKITSSQYLNRIFMGLPHTNPLDARHPPQKPGSRNDQNAVEKCRPPPSPHARVKTRYPRAGERSRDRDHGFE